MVDIRLTRVAKKAADFLDLDLAELCEVNLNADLNSKDIECLLIRMHESLHRIIGGHRAEMKLWMCSQNSHLSGIPKELIMREGRLTDVVYYLEKFK